MSDYLISRQDAKSKKVYSHERHEYVVPVAELDWLPSAQRKRGEWIPAFNGTFTGGAYWFSCSKCNRIVPEVRNGGWNFCPNCGADMRTGRDEFLDANDVGSVLASLPSAQQEPERRTEPVGCNGCRYDWLGDPRCAKCARSFQDYYEAEKEES